MNALVLVTDAFGGHGGIAQYNRDLMTALAAGPGPHRIVVLPRHGRGDGALPPGVRQLKAHGNQIVYSLSALGAAATLGPFDFVYCGHMHLSPLAALIAWFLGIPLWLQLHGWEAWEKPSGSERRAAERARLITAVSRYTRRRFLSFTGIEPSRVQVLPNTVDDCFSAGAKSDRLLDRYGLRGKRILLTVGRLDPHERRKGHDKVIQALAEVGKTFPDVVYLVVGQGEDRARLQALARSLGVDNAVLFTGGVAPDELPQLYRLADLFVMPSTQEGFGIVFLEAAASGVAVVGGNVDGSTDALADGALGIAIDPANTGALVQAIKQGLQGRAPDASAVHRFRFENFAGRVGDLVSSYLMRSAAAEAK
jgi:phosphatidylinositol alpha-1,6-mannosyltransferase